MFKKKTQTPIDRTKVKISLPRANRRMEDNDEQEEIVLNQTKLEKAVKS